MIQFEYVDLGLPSGLKWAKCNVGAEKETDYGDYFMWGSTEPNTADECTWVSYKYCDGPYDTLTKYNTSSLYGENPDNITILESVDDAASQIMGGDWRMPTKDEIQELIDNTTNQWVTNYNGSGVNGRKFISKTDTSKYIFIPAAGSCYNGSVGDVGNYCRVWSSSLDASNPYGAWFLGFFSGGCYVNVIKRCYGLSVRGVRN